MHATGEEPTVIADAEKIAEAAKENEWIEEMAVTFPESAQRYWNQLSKATADEAYLDAITDEDEIIGVLQGQCAPFLAPTLSHSSTNGSTGSRNGLL